MGFVIYQFTILSLELFNLEKIVTILNLFGYRLDSSDNDRQRYLNQFYGSTFLTSLKSSDLIYFLNLHVSYVFPPHICLLLVRDFGLSGHVRSIAVFQYRWSLQRFFLRTRYLLQFSVFPPSPLADNVIVQYKTRHNMIGFKLKPNVPLFFYIFLRYRTIIQINNIIKQITGHVLRFL